MAEMVMMTLAASETPPTIQQSAEELGVPVTAIDTDFGVVLVDTKNWVYTVRVDAKALDSSGESAEGVSGPFSDPRIEPFGLPE